MANEENAFAEICRRLEAYNKNNVELTESTDITADLNIDSVSIMDMIMVIEDEYDITIPINVLSDVRTIGDLAKTVEAVRAGG